METIPIEQLLLEPNSPESLLKTTLLANPTRQKLEEVIRYLASQGWTRRRLYDVCRYINLNQDLLEEEHDAIGNFLSELIGFTNTTNIVRLPGEPENREEFLEYVYSDWWKD